ncbi:MAG: hypothetical protein Q4B94_00300 [Pseudomonadota bacterium]|nr:hypothetical protein [Pseudomonadota bacterium]
MCKAPKIPKPSAESAAATPPPILLSRSELQVQAGTPASRRRRNDVRLDLNHGAANRARQGLMIPSG